MNLLRDDRQGRLHMRFRCGGRDVKTTGGFLGQARFAGHSALEKTAATEQVFRDFCTAFDDPPPGAAVQPIFEAEKYEHMCNIVEATCVFATINNSPVCSHSLCGKCIPHISI